MSAFTRSFPLQDIQIRNDGSGRTVEAYAAVFNHETDISDQQGRYREQLHPSSFDRSIQQRGTKFGVFYNHALTLQGTPSEMASVPLGSPIEAPRTDGVGLITVSRYNRTPLADQVLESIRNGDITGQSFSGRFVRSEPGPDRSSGKYRAARDGSLTLVTRMEVAMREYGPTPMPAYDVPMVLGVRARMGDRGRQLARVRDHFSRATLAPQETQDLTLLLAMLAGADAGLDPIVDALCAADCALDAAQMVVAAMLAVPDPDVEDAGDMPADPTVTDVTPLDPPSDTSGVGGLTTSSSGRRPSSVSRTSTAILAPAAEDPRIAHSGRLTAAQRARVGMLTRGIMR
jgi:HK97 family phage prohead protease